jgi:hypothetical protein
VILVAKRFNGRKMSHGRKNLNRPTRAARSVATKPKAKSK